MSNDVKSNWPEETNKYTVTDAHDKANGDEAGEVIRERYTHCGSAKDDEGGLL